MKATASPRDARAFARLTPSVALSLTVSALLFLANGLAFGQEGKLPKGNEILDQYVKATGGKDAYQKVSNRVTRGRLEMPAQGIKGTIESYEARPNLSYSVLEIAGAMRQERATDGKVAWERHSMTGIRFLEGKELEQFMREAVFDSDVHWRKLYQKAETIGVEDIDGKPAYKVELTIKDDKKMTAYYDTKSNLLVKSVMTVKAPMGEMLVETYISDYRKVGDLLIPHKQRQAVMGMEQVLTFDSIEVNVKLDKNRFALPDDVKELLKQREQPKKAEQKDATP